jgi:hypothetical protein
MSTSPGKAAGQARRVRRQTGKQRRRTRHLLFGTPKVLTRREEDVFWRQLEEREDGRIAQEADHLFDTSFAWAA